MKDIMFFNDYLDLQLKYAGNPEVLRIIDIAHHLASGIWDILDDEPKTKEDCIEALEDVYYKTGSSL